MNHLNHPNPLLVMMTLPGRPTHHAPPLSLNSFKSHCFAAVAAAALLVPALPASAISVNIVEATSTRFAFDLVWGPTTLLPMIVESGSVPSGYLYVRDITSSVQVTVARNSTPIDVHSYTINFLAGSSNSRVFEGVDLSNFDGSQYLALVGERYGARFVFGERFPNPPTGVPDNGASALLLSAGLAGLTLLRRTVV